MTAPSGTVPGDAVVRLLEEGIAACDEADRSDLTAALQLAIDRIRRPETVVCVVGEYKQGKSQFVNGLVGREVCPVDDDLATSALTVLRHGADLRAAVRRQVNGEAAVAPIPFADVVQYAVETPAVGALSDPADRVDLVELTVDSAFLAAGVAVVDTPGVNAFRPGHDSAVIGYLPSVDCVVVVTDASTELSPPELRFLTAAREACPAVLVAMTKIDLYPEWRRVADLNRAHLAGLGLDEDALLPVSSTLRVRAATGGDAALDAESGFGDVLAAVEDRLFDTARRTSVERGADDLARVMGILRSVERARLAALENPSGVEAQLDELQRAREVVHRMTDADARWVSVLDDGFRELQGELHYELHASMRRAEQNADRRLVEPGSEAEWDDVIAEIKVAVTDMARGTAEGVRTGSEDIADRISRLIVDDAPRVATPRRERSIDVDDLWASVERDLRENGPGALAGGLAMLLGGSSMLGLLGTIAQLAGIAVLGPVSWSAGAVFGARQFREERRRQQDRQRQEARTVVRQFLESAEVELALRIDRGLRDAQRSLRDWYGSRVAELFATYTALVGTLEESLARNDAERRELAASSGARLAELDRLIAAAGEMDGARGSGVT